MTTSLEKEIEEIKNRLDVLYSIYNTILQLLVPEEEALPDEISALEAKKDVVIRIDSLIYSAKKTGYEEELEEILEKAD